MLSVYEAKKIITENIPQPVVVHTSLAGAAGLVLAEDIYAPIDIPAYPQSSMDGYAFLFEDWKRGDRLRINGEMAAGSSDQSALQKQTAVRIFTGAAVPNGADTVVMQEKVTVSNGTLNIEDDKLQAGQNVRQKGSEIAKGRLGLTKGTLLSPAAIGFLAGIGITTIKVFKKPVISIIVTGKELQQPGNELAYGQVYESNSFALTAALKRVGIDNVSVLFADDKLDELTAVFKNALSTSDVVLLTGGVSVGDYDFVLEAAAACEVKKLFHKIKQRPGKPLFFGRKNDQLVFGLPGNPSSVLSCFYQYVSPALEGWMQKENSVRKSTAALTEAFSKQPGLTHFLKGYYDGEKVIRLDAQESYRMSSFARANCLIEIGEEVTDVEAGNKVDIHLLPL